MTNFLKCNRQPERNTSTKVTSEWEPTKEVKEVVLNNMTKTTKEEEDRLKGITIYSDFNQKYILSLVDGHLKLANYNRNGADMKYYNLHDNAISIGVQQSIDRIAFPDKKFSCVPLQVEPFGGYIFKYRTEDDVDCFIRLYVTGYKLDSNDSLKSITVQYNLMDTK